MLWTNIVGGDLCVSEDQVRQARCVLLSRGIRLLLIPTHMQTQDPFVIRSVLCRIASPWPGLKSVTMLSPFRKPLLMCEAQRHCVVILARSKTCTAGGDSL